MSGRSQTRWPLAEEATPELVLGPLAAEPNFKTRIYATLKDAIANMDVYGTTEDTWLDERQLARTDLAPIRRQRRRAERPCARYDVSGRTRALRGRRHVAAEHGDGRKQAENAAA